MLVLALVLELELELELEPELELVVVICEVVGTLKHYQMVKKLSFVHLEVVGTKTFQLSLAP